MMRKLFVLIMLAPVFAYANASVGYTNLDIDLGDGDSASLGALNIGYTMDVDDSPFSVQAGIAIGLTDDTVYGVNVELDPSFYIRGMYEVNENFFISASWINFQAELSASANGVTVSEDGSDSEAGFGLGFRPNEKVTVMFDVVEDTNLFTVQYNF
tara:strand:+ start:21 stop:488 length:468 start_codon:yes stop_codon:yes gene_type:complete